MSLVPLVVEGQADPLVLQVRRAMNVPGGNVLDRELVELLRGVQTANRMPAHGELDEQTLGLFDITAW